MEAEALQPSAGPCSLGLWRGNVALSRMCLVPGTYRIGSAAHAEIRLRDPGVAAEHARLYVQPWGVVLHDARSSGGTRVNGALVSVCELAVDDAVSCGPFTLKVNALPRPAVLPVGLPHPSKGPRIVSPDGFLADDPSLVAERFDARDEHPTEAMSFQDFLAHLDKTLEAPRPRPGRTRLTRGPLEQPPALKRRRSSPRTLALADPQPPDFGKALVRRGGHEHVLLEVYWGDVRVNVQSFVPWAKPLFCGDWGFTLPKKKSPIVEFHDGSFILHPPPMAALDLWRGNAFERAQSHERGRPLGGERLIQGSPLRLREGMMSLVATVAPAPPQAPAKSVTALPKLQIAIFGCLSMAFLFFVALAATRDLEPLARSLAPPPAAVKLLLQEKAKPPPPKKELVKKPKDLKGEVVVEKKRSTPVSAPVAAAKPMKALKALRQLTAVGPAMKDVLASMDKIGAGPGVKGLKESNQQLSSLIGSAPLANAGFGSFGLGTGGGGSRTKGSEMFRGAGGAGIGALGAHGYGNGAAVSGVVTGAPARAVGLGGSSGTIDREAVARAINAHLQEVRGCFERALLKDPGLAGKLVLEWTLSTSGSVSNARVKNSTLRSVSVESCILTSLRTWAFPSARGGLVIISYPFLFNSVGY